MPKTTKQPTRKSRNGTFGSAAERSGRSEVYVTRTLESGPRVVSETEDRSLIAVHRFITEPANVGVEAGITLNLGHFEFARLNVSVSMPCYKEEVDATYRYAQSWAKSRLQLEVTKIRDQYPMKSNSVEVASISELEKSAPKANGEVEHPF
jgi:hypothetical protein